MIWAQGVIELVRWRRQRRSQATAGQQLVAETEKFLAQVHRAGPQQGPPPTAESHRCSDPHQLRDPSRLDDPQRPSEPPRLS